MKGKTLEVNRLKKNAYPAEIETRGEPPVLEKVVVKCLYPIFAGHYAVVWWVLISISSLFNCSSLRSIRIRVHWLCIWCILFLRNKRWFSGIWGITVFYKSVEKIIFHVKIFTENGSYLELWFWKVRSCTACLFNNTRSLNRDVLSA